MNRQDPGESTQEMADKVVEQARHYTEKAQDAARQVRPIAEKSFREQPLATLLGAAAVGFVLGALWRK